MKTAKKQVTHLTDSDALRFRVLKVKSSLPQGIEYIAYYKQLFGEQSKKSIQLIRNVWNLRVSDKEVTENLEKMVEHIKAA